MKFSLCNEVVRGLDFAAQCRLAAGLGYDGLELAPFTLADEPHLLPKPRRAEIRRAAEDAGVPVTGLHWLLLAPAGLSITSPDDAVRRRTVGVMRALVELCADLGGGVLVHGSPGQLVPLEETIKSFKGLVDGEYDHLPEAAFYMVGGIDMAVEKARKLAAEAA